MRRPSAQRQILLYNPGQLTKDQLIASFIARQKELAEILELLRAVPEGGRPQHVLVLGWRGMGKTTLLHRLAHAVADDDDLSATWLPVVSDEEQPNVQGLADFWLNTLDFIAAARRSGRERRIASQLRRTMSGPALEEAARNAVLEAARVSGRRLLLLIDNVDEIFDAIEPDVEASKLREVLQHETSIMLVGASSKAIEATYDYAQPFYDMFRTVHLRPLTAAQTVALLDGLAERFADPRVSSLIRSRPGQMRTLNLLMGGNPRTVSLLFGMLVEGPSSDLRRHLEKLLDLHTDLYRDRVKALPRAMRSAFDALALHWDPTTAERVAEATGMKRGAASGQLHKLVKLDLVEKVDLPGRALGFQVKERFFNVWYLMRFGRRGGHSMRFFIEFLRLFYDAQGLTAELDSVTGRLSDDDLDLTQLERELEYTDALAHVMDRPEPRARLYLAALDAGLAAGIDMRTVLTFDRITAVVYSGEIDATDALTLAEHALAAAPDDPQLLCRTVQLLTDLGRVDDANELVEKLARLAETDPKALRDAAHALWSCGQLDRARETAERGCAADLDDAAVRELLGDMHIKERRLGDAIAALEESCAIDPSRSGAWLLLGVARGLHDDDVGATEALRRADELAPERLAALANLLVAVERTGDDGAIGERLRDVGALLDGATDGRCGLVTQVVRRWPERLEEYRAALRATIDETTRDADLLSAAGYCAYVARDFEEAVELFGRAARIEPSAVFVREHLGRSLCAMAASTGERGLFETASAHFAYVARNQPERQEIGLLRDLTHIDSLAPEARVDPCVDARQRWPMARPVLERLISAATAAQRWDVLEGELRGWVSEHPEDVGMLNHLAATIGNRGRHAEAADAVLSQIASGARDDDTWVLLAQALVRSGRVGELLELELPGADELTPHTSAQLGTALEAVEASERVHSYLLHGMQVSDPRVLIDVANALRHQDDIDSAVSCVISAAARQDMDEEQLGTLSRWARSAADADRVHRELEVALAASAGHPGLSLVLARHLRTMKRSADALAVLDDAAPSAELELPLLHERFFVLDDLGEHEDGLRLSTESADLDETFVTAGARVYFLDRLDRAAEALDLVTQQRGRFPESAQLLGQHADLLVAADRSDEALAILAEFDGTNPKLELARVKALTTLDRFDDAASVLRELVTQEPEPSTWVFRTAAALAEKADTPTALEVLALMRRATERAADPAAANGAVARVELALDRPDAALERLEAMLAGAGGSTRGEALDLMIELARRDRAADCTALLERAALGEELMPLRHALAIVSGDDPRRLERLAPETQQVVGDILRKIRGAS